MSKAKALRALKRRRMQAQFGYKMHLLDLWFAGADMPGRQTEYLRTARKAAYKKELSRP